jgi:hypothetical protein
MFLGMLIHGLFCSAEGTWSVVEMLEMPSKVSKAVL